MNKVDEVQSKVYKANKMSQKIMFLQPIVD
jgi:hypothetical protein